MSKFVTTSILIISLLGCSPVESIDAIREELIDMAAIDQEFRSRFMPMLATADFTQPPTEAFIALMNEQNEIDSRNTSRLIEIVEEIGWPKRSQFGQEASNAAQLLIQHSELEYQKQLLPYLRDAVSAGEANASNLAMLDDDILVKEGRDQIYGTEITTGPDGNFMLYPVQNPANLNARRQAMGLPTIEEYIRYAEEDLGVTIDISTLVEK